MKKSKGKSSKYLGVSHLIAEQKWLVYLEHHDHHPQFDTEEDAAIYAEYFYRQLHSMKPNFPELSDAELKNYFAAAIVRKIDSEHFARSASKQGLRRNMVGKQSVYIGVTRKRNGWLARLFQNGKSIHVGWFSDSTPDAEKRAAQAYDEKAIEIYGENARLNFPDE